MKYNIITISDIHWGAINPKEQLKSLEFLFNFFEYSVLHGISIDMIVIAGDYFDSKLPLNSRDAIYAVEWFHKLYNLALDYNVQRIRMFQGTMEHDNDQLDVFNPLMKDDSEFFRIFKNTTSEETLPGLKCIYCPDETMQTNEYEYKYTNELLSIHDIGFFHGSFDVVYGELLDAKPELMNRKNVIYRYDLWDKLIHGPLISGHWHDGKIYDNLYYCGSPFCYKFNEDEPKGFIFTEYDTDTKEYVCKKIINPLSPSYITYEIYSNMCNSQQDYTSHLFNIDEIISSFEESSYLNNKLRIQFYVVDDKVENDTFITGLRHKFINVKNVKINIKNKLKEKIKKEVSQKNKERNTTYKFIYNEEKEPSEIIQEFIRTNNPDVTIPLDYIQGKIHKYMK